jgi:dolichol-phosphate mannosyltransferase
LAKNAFSALSNEWQFMNHTKEKAVVIIPTYNEELVITETVRQVFAATEDLVDFSVEILIFDSASKDQTPTIIEALIPQYAGKLHLQKEPNKTGLGSAYMQAMHYALDELKADIVVEFDADLSHQPQYLAPMLELLKTSDVVMGSRYLVGGSIPANWGLQRKLLSVMGNHVARLTLTRRYHDLTSGFRATRRDILIQALPSQFYSNHYAYKLHLLWLLHKHQARIVEFPIHFIDREKGESKLPANSIKDALRVIAKLRYTEAKQLFKNFRASLTEL